MKRNAYAAVAAVSLTLGCISPASFNAHAESAAEFYQKRQIRMIVGHEAGNDYDLAARFLARYLARHIPGDPTITVQNMPAAASLAAANYLYAQAPRDGSVIGSFSRNVPSQARMGQSNVAADPRRFNWLGGTSHPPAFAPAGSRCRSKPRRIFLPANSSLQERERPHP